MQWLERKPEAPLATWKIGCLPWGNMTVFLRIPSQFERSPTLPTATQQTAQDFPLNERWGPIREQWLENKPMLPLATRKETWLPWGSKRGSLRSTSQLEKNPKLPAATGENPRDLPSMQDDAQFPAVTLEESRGTPHNSKGRLTSLRPHGRLPEILTETREEPRASCHNLSNTTRFSSQWEMRPDPPAVTQEQSHTPPRNLEGELTSLRQDLRFPKVATVATWEESQAYHHNSRIKHEIPPLTQDDTLFPCNASTAIPSSLSKLKRRLDSLYATQRVTRNTCHISRGPPIFLKQLEKSPVFPTSSRDEGWVPCFIWRGIQTFPTHLKRRPVSPTDTQEEPHSSCCKSKGLWVSTQLEIRPDYGAPTRI